MTSSRWFGALTNLFPKGDRDGRVLEMVDALELNPGNKIVRESLSLVWAAGVAWRRYAATREGVQRAAWAGALIWLGFLVAIGPVIRLSAVIQRDGPQVPFGFSTNPILYSIAVMALVAALILLCSYRDSLNRLAIAALFPLGLIAAAATNRVAEFQLFRSLVYELRWLGLAIALAVILKPKAPSRWPLILALAPAAMLMTTITLVSPLRGYQLYFGRNYAHFLRNGFPGRLPSGQSNLFDGAVVVLLVAVVLAPFFMPAVAAFFTVPLLGAVVAPAARDGLRDAFGMILAMGVYLAVVAIWNYRRPTFNISLNSQSDRAEQDDSSKRFDLSVKWKTDRRSW